MATTAESIAHLKAVIACNEAMAKELSDLKRKYTEKTKSHIEKKKAAAANEDSDNGEKGKKKASSKSSDKPLKDYNAESKKKRTEEKEEKKEKAKPKCSICKEPRAGNDHSKCKAALEKKKADREAKRKAKREADIKAGKIPEDEGSGESGSESSDE